MMQTGQFIKFVTDSMDEHEGEILESEPIETTGFSGTMCSIDVTGYGRTSILIQGETVTADNVQYRSERCGLPSQLSSVKWSDFRWSYYGSNMEKSREFAVVRKFVYDYKFFMESQKGIYIYGRLPGCGKSLLLAVLANETIARHSFSVKYCTLEKLLNLVKNDEQASKEELKAIRNCILLFMDDFGSVHSNSRWMKDQVCNLIETRQRDGHVTCYASSEPIERIKIDDTGKANDIIVSSTIGIRLPDVAIRAKLATDESAEFEKRLFQG